MEQTFLFNGFSTFLQHYFDKKVQKISVNAGFSCPNRDGKINRGGCTYCNNQTFNPAYCRTDKSISRQLEEGKAFFARKYPSMEYLAYFQAFTNTYAELSTLKQLYEEALTVSGVVGLVIGTRPDCMPQALLDYLQELHRSHFILIEYGIESTNNQTLARINRGHTFETTIDAVKRTAQVGIPVGGHVILGLPGESSENIVHQAEILSGLPISILKLHQLQLIKGTSMAAEYDAHPYDFHIYTLDEYIELVIDYIERLRPDIVLERFVSQSPPELLHLTGWKIKNHEYTERLKHRMRERHTWQGRLYRNQSI